ncbi:helix-turn-helix domain-containing protein [Salinibius halmophilus]|uniref:helix-turn-helix domain-containing protein n=1 Tax=Salinibius halmophilus TaxID=1853216 RepID=UPI000E662C64|nr:helix-turn-helix domain-containing protein [Salinibius halmophilus]
MQAKQVLNELKLYLKEHGLTYSSLAEQAALPEITVKRLMNRDQVRFDQLQTLCESAGSSLLEIMQRVQNRQTSQLKVIDADIADALFNKPELYVIGKDIKLGCRSIESLASLHKVKHATAYKLCRELETLGFIEINGDKLLPSTPAPAILNPEVHRQFYDLIIGNHLNHMRSQMANSDNKEDRFGSFTLLLTDEDYIKVQEQLNELVSTALERSEYNQEFLTSRAKERLLNVYLSPKPAPPIAIVKDE